MCVSFVLKQSYLTTIFTLLTRKTDLLILLLSTKTEHMLLTSPHGFSIFLVCAFKKPILILAYLLKNIAVVLTRSAQ